MLVIKFTICVAVLVLVEPVYQAHIEASPASSSSRSSPVSGVWRQGVERDAEATRSNGTAGQNVMGRDQVKRIPIGQWSSRKRVGQYFTEWSPWSSCDANDCRQSRERLCRLQKKCAHTKQVAERRCSICKEQQPQSEHHHRRGGGGDTHHSLWPMTGRHHSHTNNNNMSASHSVLESDRNSLDRSADVDGVPEYDWMSNKFAPKLLRDTAAGDQHHHHPQTDDSELHIIKINHKKIVQQPETLGNKLNFARPVLAVQIIPDDHNNNHSLMATNNESDGSAALFGGPPILDNNELPDNNDDDDNDNYTDADYQADDGSEATQGQWGNRRKYKNGQAIKKYTPMGATTTTAGAADPKGAYRVYTRWSKWSKCSGKCTTRRFKRCRLKEVCGNEVLREVAYCYTEGSFCEEWIVRQMYSNVPRSPGAQMVQQNQVANEQQQQQPPQQPPISRNSNSFQERKLPTRATGIAPGPGQCGIATAVSNRRKPASHMLRIIGGRVVRRGSYPWQVAILNRFKEAFCGGTLISKQWILTAAHCVRKRLYVRLGEHNLEERDGTEVEYRVEYAIRHPYYDKTTVDNDIALLRLPREIIPSAYIGFACLPEKYQKLPVGTKCTIIGWGKRKNLDDAGTKYLHEAQVPIVPNEDCKEVYDDYTITKNMFCAGHKRGRIDTCSGDSGGPLLCRDPTTSHWSILGVTSFGDGCGKRNKFGIYTKVSNYVDWIQSVIECSGNCRRF